LMVEPVDMRRGIDGLFVLVEQALLRSLCAGSAFVFCNRAGNRIKCVAVGRHRRVVGAGAACIRGGSFGNVRMLDGMELTSSQWEWLIAGVGLASFGAAICARKYS
ncbi:MAG: IS66 family insertion sequence element accessory protein TnpB, partial [Nitrosomonas sp.]|nr:IS66 family insertion sequence element accessory protein TnpB [Nitrosomonas sp.]